MPKRSESPCEAVQSQLVLYLKGDLELKVRETVEAHLSTCEPCKKELEVACRLLSISRSASGPAMDQRVESLIAAAVERNASDVHLDPGPESARVRFRVHGALADLPEFWEGGLELIQRLKLRAGMDLTETRRPQVGRISAEFSGDRFEVGVGTMPVRWGERMVLRLIGPVSSLPALDEILPDESSMLKSWVEMPSGLIFVAGPSGSGKTTTAYVLLAHAARAEANTVAIGEVEIYRCPDVVQIELLGAAGDASMLLRSVLSHQDPDVVMIEEATDSDTVSVLMEIALSGHLVIVGVHARTAADAVERWIRLGADPRSMAEALVGIAVQRLARKNCGHCAVPERVGPDGEALGLDPASELRRGEGCDHCGGTGFRGRSAFVGLYAAQEHGLDRMLGVPSLETLREAVEASEVRTLKASAASAVSRGQVTVAEARRVLSLD